MPDRHLVAAAYVAPPNWEELTGLKKNTSVSKSYGNDLKIDY